MWYNVDGLNDRLIPLSLYGKVEIISFPSKFGLFALPFPFSFSFFSFFLFNLFGRIRKLFFFESRILQERTFRFPSVH